MFVSSSTGGWEDQNQGAGTFRVWWKSFPGLQMAALLLCPHMTVQGVWGALESALWSLPLIKELIPS